VRFRLVQVLSSSNNPTSSFVVLCYGLLCSLGAWLRCMCLSVFFVRALDASQAATFIVRRTAL
jgi:hypothetical protein